MSLTYGLDPKNLHEAGWGLLLPADLDPEYADALLNALQPLLDLRERQAGRVFRIYKGPDGVRGGIERAETKNDFLRRHGAGPGPVDPNRLPYYLLILADPVAIPFEFQTQLDLQHAVGRVWFDSPDSLHEYAKSVVSAETGTGRGVSDWTFFSPHHPEDWFTRQSGGLLRLLAERLRPVLKQKGARLQHFAGKEARIAALQDLLADLPPLLLFSAGHSLVYPPGDPRQSTRQGALVCADWLGPSGAAGPFPETLSFGADGIPGGGDLRGLIFIQYSSFSLGTPQLETLSPGDATRRQLAPESFVASLPQRLLGLPYGRGALAAVGWIDRLWSYATPEGTARELALFENSLARLAEGVPLGAAFEPFQERYAELASELTRALEDLEYGALPDEARLAENWAALNNARSLAIFGDPAVRLAVPVAPPAEVSEAELYPRPISKGLETSPEGTVVLEIRLARRGIAEYAVELDFSGSGTGAGAKGTARLDFRALQAHQLDPQEYGRRLLMDIFAQPALRSLYKQVRSIAVELRQPLYVRLVIDPTATELHALRWECLFDPDEGSFLALQEGWVFSRYLFSAVWHKVEIRPLTRLRSLAVIPEPTERAESGGPRVDTAGSREIIQRSLAQTELSELPARDGRRATLDELTAALRAGTDLLFLICELAVMKGEVWLSLEDNTGRTVRVPGIELANRLKELPVVPRLVVLGYGGGVALAPALAEAGVPAVVAMNDHLTIESAREFLPASLGALLAGAPADQAMAGARRSIRHRPDWWAPALFTRLKDGKLW
jgi:hypothetical protein